MFGLNYEMKIYLGNMIVCAANQFVSYKWVSVINNVNMLWVLLCCVYVFFAPPSTDLSSSTITKGLTPRVPFITIMPDKGVSSSPIAVCYPLVIKGKVYKHTNSEIRHIYSNNKRKVLDENYTGLYGTRRFTAMIYAEFWGNRNVVIKSHF